MSTKIDVNTKENFQLERFAEGIAEMNSSATKAGLPPYVLISKNGTLVTPARGSLRPLTTQALATLARIECEPGKHVPDKDDPTVSAWKEFTKLPRDLVQAYIERGLWTGIPEIRQVAPAPIIRPDFTVRWDPGWDEDTGTWVTPGVKQDRAFEGMDPRGLFREFALVDRRLEADCLAAALTPLLSTAMPGALPGFIVTAQKPSSGKSELAEMMARIGGAGAYAITRWPGRDELSKTVSSYIGDDARVVIFDNIKSKIDSPDLESVITSRKSSFRAMRKHSTTKLASNTTWYFTVNGAHVSPDMTRRCIVVSLDTDRFPVKWTGTMPSYSKSHEAALVTLMCSLIESWRDAGRRPGSVVHDGFEEWSRTVSGVLEHVGITGMWEAREAVLDDAITSDVEDEAEYLKRLAAVMGGRELTGAQLWNDLDSTFDADARVLRDWFGKSSAVGANLRKIKGRKFDGIDYTLEYRKTRTERLWQIVPDTSGTTTAHLSEAAA